MSTYSNRLQPSSPKHIIACCLVLPPEIVMHDAYIGGLSENNIKCFVHDNLGRKNRTTRYKLQVFCRVTGFISQFHSCGIYLVLSRSPSIISELFERISKSREDTDDD